MLEKTNLFHTPRSQKELWEYIDSLTGPGEKRIATTIFGMTWNLCSDLQRKRVQEIADSIKKEE